MRRLGFVFTLFCLLLAACAAPAADIPAASPGPSASQTLTPKDTSTALSASLTPDTLTPDTPTITPLPTIPTFTPAFDVRTIVTATPAPKAECPKENPELVPDFRIPIMPDCFENDACMFTGTEKEIQAFLNEGGSISSVISRLKLSGFQNCTDCNGYKDYSYTDVTNDSQPDLVFKDFSMGGRLFVLYCTNEQYDVKELITDEGFLQLGATRDLNGDNVPDILALTSYGSGFGNYQLYIYEWDGQGFANLNLPNGMWGLANLKIQDSKSGVQDILLTGDRPGTGSLTAYIPWRYLTSTYTWNGKNFTESHSSFETPKFRFQAVQDADMETVYGKYVTAFRFYQDVIFSDKLDWWSHQRFAASFQEISGTVDTPDHFEPADGIPDPTEYPRLAAYAYYRMIILHTFLGETEAAQVKYATLQKKFPADSPGYPYVEMATGFWNAYQSSGLMYDACAAAIAYADAHPEILTPLGSDYHGAQSRQYQPADVCPFR
ncbi:MAG: hypothetical protein L6461_23385 [Anaerolineae bacterium]|nr:hypothetical protein [Anaerolineae bacterium]